MGHEADDTFSIEKIAKNSIQVGDQPIIMIQGHIDNNRLLCSRDGKPLQLEISENNAKKLHAVKEIAYSAFDVRTM